MNVKKLKSNDEFIKRQWKKEDEGKGRQTPRFLPEERSYIDAITSMAENVTALHQNRSVGRNMTPTGRHEATLEELLSTPKRQTQSNS